MMSPRQTKLSCLALVMAVMLIVVGCQPAPDTEPSVQTPPRSETPSIPLSPRQAAQAGTTTPAAVVTTSTGGFDIGFAVMGSTTAKVGELVTTVLWISTDTTEPLAFAGGQNRFVSNIFVTDAKGDVILDVSGLRRRGHGPRAYGTIDSGSPIVVVGGFKLEEPGEYSVFNRPSFSVSAQGPDTKIRAVTPPIAITVE